MKMKRVEYLDGQIVLPESQLDRQMIAHFMELQLHHEKHERLEDFTLPDLTSDGTAQVCLTLDEDQKQESVTVVLQEIEDEPGPFYDIAIVSKDSRLITVS
jgi:hypothetical protein